MQCTSNTCKHFERFNFRSQASTVAWRGWRIAHLALPYLFTFTASPESHRLMYGSVPDCQWNQWPVSNISLSEMASARASAQLWWWWWWVISLVSPLVSSLVGGAVYANVIWPGMKWKYAAGARTHDPWIVSPTPYRLATAPPRGFESTVTVAALAMGLRGSSPPDFVQAPQIFV